MGSGTSRVRSAPVLDCSLQAALPPRRVRMAAQAMARVSRREAFGKSGSVHAFRTAAEVTLPGSFRSLRGCANGIPLPFEEGERAVNPLLFDYDASRSRVSFRRCAANIRSATVMWSCIQSVTACSASRIACSSPRLTASVNWASFVRPA